MMWSILRLLSRAYRGVNRVYKALFLGCLAMKVCEGSV